MRHFFLAMHKLFLSTTLSFSLMLQVTHFEYNGKVVVTGGEQFVGQGAVKRFFYSMLQEGGFTGLELLDVPQLLFEDISSEVEGKDEAGTTLRVALISEAGAHELDLQVQFSNGLIRECHLRQNSQHQGLLPLLGGGVDTSQGVAGDDADGPDWETFDGRCATSQHIAVRSV